MFNSNSLLGIVKTIQYTIYNSQDTNLTCKPIPLFPSPPKAVWRWRMNHKETEKRMISNCYIIYIEYFVQAHKYW